MAETNTSTDAAGVSIDELFETLANAENRYVLTYVVESGGSVETRELVEYVLEWTECPPDLSDDEFAEQVRSRVERVALPALDEAGLVAYDESEGVVRSTDGTAIAEPHLELALGADTSE